MNLRSKEFFIVSLKVGFCGGYFWDSSSQLADGFLESFDDESIFGLTESSFDGQADRSKLQTRFKPGNHKSLDGGSGPSLENNLGSLDPISSKFIAIRDQNLEQDHRSIQPQKYQVEKNAGSLPPISNQLPVQDHESYNYFTSTKIPTYGDWSPRERNIERESLKNIDQHSNQQFEITSSPVMNFENYSGLRVGEGELKNLQNLKRFSDVGDLQRAQKKPKIDNRANSGRYNSNPLLLLRAQSQLTPSFQSPNQIQPKHVPESSEAQKKTLEYSKFQAYGEEERQRTGSKLCTAGQASTSGIKRFKKFASSKSYTGSLKEILDKLEREVSLLEIGNLRYQNRTRSKKKLNQDHLEEGEGRNRSLDHAFYQLLNQEKLPYYFDLFDEVKSRAERLTDQKLKSSIIGFIMKIFYQMKPNRLGFFYIKNSEIKYFFAVNLFNEKWKLEYDNLGRGRRLTDILAEHLMRRWNFRSLELIFSEDEETIRTNRIQSYLNQAESKKVQIQNPTLKNVTALISIRNLFLVYSTIINKVFCEGIGDLQKRFDKNQRDAIEFYESFLSNSIFSEDGSLFIDPNIVENDPFSISKLNVPENMRYYVFLRRNYLKRSLTNFFSSMKRQKRTRDRFHITWDLVMLWLASKRFELYSQLLVQKTELKNFKPFINTLLLCIFETHKD